MTTWIWGAFAAAAIVALLWVLTKQRKRGGATAPRRPHAMDALDTVDAWEPNGTRVLSASERLAYALITRALPEYMVLAQLPLSRFIRVPTRYSYSEWLKRVGSLSADLVVCDRSSEVIAVVEVRAPRESPRSRERLERMRRVLKAAHIKLLVWNEGDLPTPSAVRDQLLPAAARAAAEAAEADNASVTQRRFGATPLSAVPVGDVDTVPDDPAGDLREPPPSTWFDDLDAPVSAPAPLQR
jgi:hypothetical protein